MKKFIKMLAIVLCLATVGAVTVSMSACGEEKNILVCSREDGSGTRDAFDSLIVNAENKKLKDSELVSSVEKYNTTGDITTKVAATKTAIGYVSLGSLSEEVKAIKVGGVEASAANVINDTYKLWRPFVIMTNKAMTDAGTLTGATKDFLLYLQSSQAQSVVSAQKYIQKTSSAHPSYVPPADVLSGQVRITGSTSVDPLMRKLIENYRSVGGAKVSAVDFSIDCQGSSYGIADAKSDTSGNTIGLNSSAVKSADASSLSYFDVALDAVAVVVHKSNTIENITINQLYDIYTGEVTRFSQLTVAG